MQDAKQASLRDVVLEYRAKENMSIKSFARLAGVTPPTVSKIERGEKPTRLVMAKVAKAVGMTYSEFSP